MKQRTNIKKKKYKQDHECFMGVFESNSFPLSFLLVCLFVDVLFFASKVVEREGGVGTYINMAVNSLSQNLIDTFNTLC